MTVTIHGSVLSPYVRKVHVVLREKGIDFNINPITPFFPPDNFAELNPLKKIPIFEEDGFILPDSSVISAYLDRQYPVPKLFPSPATEYATTLWLQEYADNAVIQCTTMHIFLQKIVYPKFLGKQTDQAIVDKAINEELPEVCRYLENKLQGKKYFVADQFTLADISVASAFQNLYLSGFEIDANQYPHLADHLANCWQRDSFTEQAKLEQQALT